MFAVQYDGKGFAQRDHILKEDFSWVRKYAFPDNGAMQNVIS